MKIRKLIALVILCMIACVDELPTCTITISSTENGSVAIANHEGNSVSVVVDSKVTVLATPDFNCEFVGWFVGNSKKPISTDTYYTFTANKDVVLVAKFEKIKRTIAVSATDGGAATIKDHEGSSAQFVIGSDVTVIAMPDENYEFEGWFANNEKTPISTNTTYTFAAEENIDLLAKFEKAKRTVSVSANKGGSASIKDNTESSVLFSIGSTVTIIATPDENYEFVGWFSDRLAETAISTDATYTFVVEDNTTLMAKFEMGKKTIAVSALEGGSVEIKDCENSFIELSIGSTVTVIATPDENYNFIGWFVGDENTPISTNATYTFRAVESVELTAKFEKAKKTVSISTSNGGSATIKDCTGSSAQFAVGEEVTVEATPNEGYIFIGWFADRLAETAISTDATYTFVIEDNTTLMAKFEMGKKGISVSASEGGSAIINGVDGGFIELSIGSTVTVIATPDENYNFIGWFVGDENTPISTNATYTFRAVESVELTAKFEKAKKTVSISTSNGGSATIKDCAGSSAQFAVGEEVTVEATPNEGYIFIGWFADRLAETAISTDATYTFVIEDNTTLMAKFEMGKKTIAVSALEGGSVEIKDCENSFIELSIGSTVTVIATPDENYNFIGWFVGDENTPISTNATYTFRAVESVELTAKFEKTKKTVSISTSNGGSATIKDCAGSSAQFAVGEEVTVEATPNEGYIFIGWFADRLAETAISTDATYTFVIEDNTTLMAKFEMENLPTVSVSAGIGGSASIMNNDGSSAQFAVGSAVTVIATPDEGYGFIGWFANRVSDIVVSNEATYTFVIEENTTLMAKFEELPEEIVIDLSPTGSVDGYEYVDLGLSVKWATYNVGANNIDEIGEYYAWGETTPYSKDFTFINYEWYHFPCSPDRTLASIYDAATVNWSRQWRMPTYEEQKELIDGCDWVWVDNINGREISGYVGVSQINGKSIFLPASQFISHDKLNVPTEKDAIYWSSTSTGVPGSLGLQAASTADVITFNPSREFPVEWGIWEMGDGATIRAVVGTPNDYFPDPKNLTVDEAETERQGFSVSGNIGGYTYVDMGLPSRTLWATYNVGADLPVEYGNYYAWGETTTKDSYTDENYKFFNGYKQYEISYTQYTKYVYLKNHGQIDGKYVLDNIDDAAYVNWGEKWCTPSQEQYKELNDYCRFWRHDIVVNGKKIIGCIGESCINGNRIFIPAAGWEYDHVPNNHMWVWYWTRDLSKETNNRAMQMIFDEENNMLETGKDSGRSNGMPIRAVVKNK